MAITSLINGKSDTHPLLSNRGLAYGDGLFETIAVVNGELRFWDAHLKRLAGGCERLGISPPDPGFLLDDATRLISAVPLETPGHVLKIIVTRGVGGRGYAPPENTECVRILQLFKWPQSHARWHSDGLKIGICTTQLSRNPQLAGMKHLNRLEQVLGARECALQAWDEGLMFDTDGNLICGTKTNVFLLRGNTIETPEITHSGVLGVMRGKVMDAGKNAGINIAQTRLGRDDLMGADGVFVTNAIMGITPVARLAFNDGAASNEQTFKDFSVSRRLQDLISS